VLPLRSLALLPGRPRVRLLARLLVLLRVLLRALPVLPRVLLVRLLVLLVRAPRQEQPLARRPRVASSPRLRWPGCR
jgi:uncharacterized RDD family membrane protein YckC